MDLSTLYSAINASEIESKLIVHHFHYARFRHHIAEYFGRPKTKVIITNPVPPHSSDLINTDTLSRCKPGVRIVNVARGGIVDEEALLAALESGQCGGAGLDVFREEPPTDLRLVQHPAVICSPHLGASTREAQLRVATELAEQICTGVRVCDGVG